ncbi:MAG TPA: SMP-30/gluconolactonase/LRE family protein [Bryobacteraceae bacterium]|nr:SMP-30/gluconolactonase/LRE family protein [Bryobacteraceae bacterium]
MTQSRFQSLAFAICLAVAAVWLSTRGGSAAADAQAVPVLSGIRSAEAVAVNPQGAPMVASATAGGGIARVLGRNSSVLLAETSGAPAAMAFDAEGDLYVADRQLREIFRVTRWGRVEIVAENLGSPEGIAVGPDGNIYVTDSAASCVYRLSPKGERAICASGVSGAKGIVVSADSGHIFVSDKANRIWRFALDGTGRMQFAALSGVGRAAALALDQGRNLYVAWDGGGKVSAYNVEGQQVAEYRLPGRRATGIAFGGYDLNVLYVTEAETGALYKVRVPQRSQRLLWEHSQELQITEPADGAILNRHDGEPSPAGLRIRVKGVTAGAGPVRVNGAPAEVKDGVFESRVLLREPESKILAEGPGGLHDEVTVLWDRRSFPRYRFSTDDNIWFLRDIARHASTYKSIFDNDYLAFWREMHRKYGTKIHHNIYYETTGFNLSQMPDKFREEWRANADWLRLTFHARANDPARPYVHASAEQIRQDYLMVNREIERFAGKELLSPVTTIHWGAATQPAAAALRKEGVRVLLGVDAFRDDIPYVGYHLSVPQYRRILGRDYWKDTREDIIFIHHDIVVNSVPLDKIAPYLERIVSDPHESEVLELIIHEQYFYPDYRGYEPDYRARVERAIEWVTRRGYKPVFFGDGFLGTP